MLALLILQVSFTQTNTSLDLESGSVIYQIIDYAELKGIIPKIKQEKPYVKSLVLENLKLIDRRRDMLTDDEQRIVKAYIDKNDNKQDFAFLAVIESDNNLEAFDLSHPHSINALGLQVQSNIFNWLSADITFSMMLDRTNEEAFLPYEFVKTWDHHHVDPETRADTSYEEFAISNRSQEELAMATDDGSSYLRFGRFLRDWGPGEHSLILSDTARPFIGIEAGFPMTDFAYFTSVVGSLGMTVSNVTDSEQKMISAHKLTITPADWLSLSVWESVVYGKRFELAYISPVSVYLVSQMGIAGDRDNSTLGFDFEIKPVDSLNFYGSIFIDEIEGDRMMELFTYPKNMFAWYTGIETALPFLSFGTASLQYTKLEPFVYTHYPQPYDFYKTPININYTNDGTAMAYPLPPNSDEIKLNVTFLPTPEVGVDFNMSYIRHGDNPDAAGGEYLIMGDIDETLSYDNLAEYPDKDFLNDGIYEHIFNTSIMVNYGFKNIPLTLNAGYGFSYAANYKNIEGNKNFKNVITIGGSYKYKLW
jgi:hypothetical protein